MRNKSENASAYSGDRNNTLLLYTYVPKENTVERDGLLSTRLTSEGYRKYMDRFGTREREDTLRGTGQVHSRLPAKQVHQLSDVSHPRRRRSEAG